MRFLMRCCRCLSIFVAMCFVMDGYAAESSQPVASLQQQIETLQMAELARIQSDTTSHLADFATDGCSGGLSEGWKKLGRLMPAFEHKFGAQPPYEFCCVAHDRAYWRGETQDGYQKRLRADSELRQCVAEYGREHRAEFAHDFSLPEQTIVNNFQIIADLMFYAVRVGGQPCTALPWRWGYGWPDCAVPALNNHSADH